MATIIPFNQPLFLGEETEFVKKAISSRNLSGDGPFSQQCEQWFENIFTDSKVLMVTSATHALEIAAMLIEINPGDEVIMPSFTFVSTANAFVLRGAKIIFIDVDPATMNMDTELIEEAITSRTKAIVPVHYAGIACDMNRLQQLSEKYGIYIIEDAAQAMMSKYQGRYLGSFGHLAAISFHETKNFTSGGQGGLLVINSPELVQRAEIIRDNGTNRQLFLRRATRHYSWHDIGSSFVPSELQCAYLCGQLPSTVKVTDRRRQLWENYYTSLENLQVSSLLVLPEVPDNCYHNGHIFYLKCTNEETRNRLIDYLREDGILAHFHFVPLHSSPAGKKFGHFHGVDRYTSDGSKRLVRLPLWFDLSESQQARVVKSIKRFFAEAM